MNWRPSEKWPLGYSHRSEVDHELEGDGDFISCRQSGTVRCQSVDPSALERRRAGRRLRRPGHLSATGYATERHRGWPKPASDWTSLQETASSSTTWPAGSAEEYNGAENPTRSAATASPGDAPTFRAGVARDDSPVSRPYRTPRLPDQDRMWYSLEFDLGAVGAFRDHQATLKIDIVDTPEVDLTTSTS